MPNLGLAVLYYFAAYTIVTLIGIGHTIFNIYVLHYKSMKDSPDMGEAYEKTKPFHPLYNLLVFPFFAWLYCVSLPGDSFAEVLLPLGFLWLSITIILDLFGWVIIKHPWSLSFKEFYVDYQPWISITYLVIFASPFIAWLLIFTNYT